MRFHLGKNGVFIPPSTTNYPSFTRHAQENYPIDFGQLKVKPGDTLTCFAEAIDNSPDSSVSTTPTLHIQIISVEDFNQFVRENTDFSDLLGKYGQVMDQLREQIEKQIKLRDQAESLQKQTNGQPVQAEWEKLLNQQTELNKSLQEFSSSIDQLIRDQPAYDIEKEWNKTLKELAQTIKASADTNAAELTALAPNPGQGMMKSLDAFKQSAERQLASLGVPEKEMQEKVIDTAEQLSLLHELMKDFTAYEQMFKTQGNITDQSKAFNRPGALPREDQLSLKNMAGLEHEIEQGLESLTQKLREDAREAEAQFPKAASSARTMADKMEQLRLSYLASQTTESMLSAQGQQSNQRAERLRTEMESLCSDCQGGEGDSANEADGYLKAQKNLNPGKTLQQMKFSQKFGNKPGVGKGQG